MMGGRYEMMGGKYEMMGGTLFLRRMQRRPLIYYNSISYKDFQTPKKIGKKIL